MALLEQFRYETDHDVQSRIGNSIIRYKNIHVLATLSKLERPEAGPLEIDLWNPIRGTKVRSIHSSDTDIDVRAFPIGYYNTKVTTSNYAMRLPVRKPKQGLAAENTYVITNEILMNRERMCNSIPRQDLASEGFYRMLEDSYPTVDECLRGLRDSKSPVNTKSLAFHKKFQLTEDEVGLIKLYYWGQPICVYNSRKEIFSLSERFEHYKPILESFKLPVTTTAD